MIKALARGLSRKLCLTPLFPFSNNNNEKGGLVPLAFDNSEKFYKNVYGIEMKKHILPFNTHNFPWNQ